MIEAVRVGGSYGFTMEPVQRTLRGAQLRVIGDGSSQMKRGLIARQMGL
jgi:alkylation response protein AidB-like acyl-CoA dehydrogenase